MYLSKITLAIAATALATCVASASEMKTERMVQGRSGIATVRIAEPSTPTIALSKQGQGIGTPKAEEPQQRAARYHNGGRQSVNPTLMNRNLQDADSKD